jgi:hypothetical protein
MLPIAGPSQEVTDALRLRVFLLEIDRQADLFNRSLADSIAAAARDDPTDAWRHVQSALFAAIVVYRLIANDRPRAGHPGWSKEQAREAAKWRVRELRRSLMLPDPDTEPDWPVYRVAAVRDSLEHVDERLDRAVRSDEIDSISDWYLSSGSLLLTPEGSGTTPGSLAGLRTFVVPAGILFFDRTQLDMFALDVEMLNLRNNAKQALADEAPQFTGRLLYGGGRWERIADEDIATRWHTWTTRRAAICAEFEGEVPPIPWVLHAAPAATNNSDP